MEALPLKGIKQDPIKYVNEARIAIKRIKYGHWQQKKRTLIIHFKCIAFMARREPSGYVVDAYIGKRTGSEPSIVKPYDKQ